MVNQACPQCGSPRQADVAVCGTCLYDFEAAEDSPHLPASSIEPRLNRRRVAAAGGAAALGVLVVFGVVFGGRNASQTAQDPAGSAAASSLTTPAPTPRRTPAPAPGPSSAQDNPLPAKPPGPAGASNSDSFAILPGQQPADFAVAITCSGPIGMSDPIAIVELHADPYTGESVLRDYADPGNPRTACTSSTSGWYVEQILDSRHLVLSAGGYGSYAVVDVPEVRFHWFQMPVAPGFQTAGGPEWSAQFVAISPRLDQVVWVKSGKDGIGREVHISTTAGDHVVASLPDFLGGRCGSAEDSHAGAFSRSGGHLMVLDQTTWSLNSLLVFEGETVVLSVVPPADGWPAGGHPAVPLWSPTSETLYFRQGGDVWQWTPTSGTSLFLPGVEWFRPTITPDGSHMAYAAPGPDGLFDVFLIDVAHGGSPELIGEARDGPVFLNDTQLWYKTPNIHGCAGSEQEPLIYDITDGVEFPSIIERVYRVWPGTSSVY